MKRKFKVCNRLEIEGRDKAVWPNTGMTLTVKDDGKMTLFDGRTNTNYFLFEIEDKATTHTHTETKDSAPQRTSTDSFSDLEAPF